MRVPVRVTLAAVGAALAAGGAAFAHHSYAGYDLDREVTVRGTVKQFAWSNPHSVLLLMAPDAGGKVAEWSIEGGGPNRLAARGWTAESLKPGDKADIVLNPRSDGAPFGRMVRASVDGKPVGQQRTGDRPAARPLPRGQISARLGSAG